MESHYSTCYSFPLYDPPRFTDESKSAFVGDEQDSALDDKRLDSANTANSNSASESRRTSVLKVEDEFSATPTSAISVPSHMWPDRSHENHPMRSFTTPHPHMMNGNGQPFVRMDDPAYTPGLQHPATWPISQSGATTPTPIYSQVFDMQYGHTAPGFATYAHDPTSAVPMSPQSSQGGWASATSSDGTDQRGLISPTYRPTSPGTVMRPDGIRKKNARFEIPKERNLANIDAMIMASTDETEKKELKQQKRLLRNRQAALDSRQRKKTHTEKLEQEKKISEKRLLDLEDGLGRLENTLAMEREQFVQQRQHMENIIHALQYDRDEAIRTKTVETTDLRRQVMMLQDCIKEMERQQQNTNNRDYSELGFDWDNEFDSMNDHGLNLEDQRQATPKPSTSTYASLDTKAENGFSWTTFYMCLLFGAFVASNANNNNVDNGAASAIASSIPSTEASNVLKTVLNSGHVVNNLIPPDGETTPSSTSNGINRLHSASLDSNVSPPSSLDHLHQSLSAPSRRQEMASAFAMSASTYQHLTDPFNDPVDVDSNSDLLEPPPPPQPSALQKAFASMQAQKDNLDKITGMGSKARERSLLWDQVPPEVVKNFEALVHQNSNGKTGIGIENMEQ